MPDQVSCPSCGQLLQVPDGTAATRMKCPKCEHVFTPPAGTPFEDPQPEPQYSPPAAPTNASGSRSRLVPVLVGACLMLVIGAVVAAYLLLGDGGSGGSDSRFAGEIGQGKYEEVPAPATPPVFRWDFSLPDVVHTYDYEQKMSMHTQVDMGALAQKGNGNVEQEISANGLVLVKSQGDGTADMEMKDLKMRISMDLGGLGSGSELASQIPKTREETMPSVVLSGVQEDGAGSSTGNGQEMMLKMLFPLPSKQLKVGESVDIPAEMPGNAMGAMMELKGRSRITLNRYVRIDERICAQLDVDTDISSQEAPEGIEGKFDLSANGQSEYYFDVESRSFVSGTTTLKMKLNMDMVAPKMDAPGGLAPNMPKRIKTSMVADTLTKVTLRE